MSGNDVAGVLVFMLIVVFGVMIGTYQVAKVDAGYVVIPSNRYCEGLGYVKEQPAERKP